MESDDRVCPEVNNTTDSEHCAVTGVDIPSIMIDHCIKLKKH
jgi:hypothetical protein